MLSIPRILIEHKAGQIVDPVERLRYLQRSSAIVQPRAPRISWRLRRLPTITLALLLGCLLAPGYKASHVLSSLPLSSLKRVSAGSPDVFPNVWLVDKSSDFETYSNGLRIDDRFTAPNDKRIFYPVYRSDAADLDEPEWRSQPAGIVYHTTESDQARFTEEENARLKRIGKAVIGVVQQNHSYHFLIDRFGQVYRIVPEEDIANHAGYSIWADNTGIYVNLNASFLGVAFETQTQQGDQPSANPAQIHAARVLTEMLRNKYHIPQADCVTHAQVSVNPDNMLIGYHTDWAGNFPFLALGLPDNYTAPPPSIYAFGFDYDPTFVHATGVRLWQGLALAEDQMQTQAAARGLSVPQYRAILQKKYKEILAALKRASASDKKNET
ncbi:MAG TPA: peptidoglycan recognition family protein [Bryobacteraceae bacterium]|nr:peptidoglycan recognition family protein [Bryobacteraceae bacterium]